MINPIKGGYPYEALFISPRVAESLPPLIVCPHGGPHISHVADFTVWTACFIGLGYSAVFGNASKRERGEGKVVLFYIFLLDNLCKYFTSNSKL